MTTTSNWGAGEPLTVAKLLELAKTIAGPALVSWSGCPEDQAYHLEHDGRRYTYAHPSVWVGVKLRAPGLAIAIQDADAVRGEAALAMLQPLFDALAKAGDPKPQPAPAADPYRFRWAPKGFDWRVVGG